MTDAKSAAKAASEAEDTSIDHPRLTPQGRDDPSGKGEDQTSPMPGEIAKGGQGSKAEG
jgi:hypothetical protein